LDRQLQDPLAPANELPASLPVVHALGVKDLYDESPDRSPLLLALHWHEPGHLAWLDWSVNLAVAEWAQSPYRPSLCAWLAAGEGASAFNQLPDRLEKRLLCRVQSNPAGAPQDAYLRYFDPRVLPRVLQLLSAAQRRALLSPTRAWYQMDRDGSLLRHLPLQSASDPAIATGLPLCFDAVTTAALQRIDRLSRLAQTLQDQGDSVLHEFNERLDQALCRAVSLGLTEEADQVAFASACFRDDDFVKRPDLPRLCRLAAESGLPFDAVLSQSSAAALALG